MLFIDYDDGEAPEQVLASTAIPSTDTTPAGNPAGARTQGPPFCWKCAAIAGAVLLVMLFVLFRRKRSR